MSSILIPVDLSEVSPSLVEYAATFDKRGAACFRLLHVIPPVAHTRPFNIDPAIWRRETAKGLRERCRHLHQLATCLRDRHQQVSARIVRGSVNTAIVEEARQIKADLIIMGSQDHGDLYHAVFGGTGYKVRRKAPCPVMLVPRKLIRPESPGSLQEPDKLLKFGC